MLLADPETVAFLEKEAHGDSPSQEDGVIRI